MLRGGSGHHLLTSPRPSHTSPCRSTLQTLFEYQCVSRPQSALTAVCVVGDGDGWLVGVVDEEWQEGEGDTHGGRLVLARGSGTLCPPGRPCPSPLQPPRPPLRLCSQPPGTEQPSFGSAAPGTMSRHIGTGAAATRKVASH
ncbi:hypothetical protein E2C01_050982 [Portunus trituberculatus]|uniref:Uncharacterized protein n=1 Tax=Portunus trituberculatus TaxID=210409 RepID=A0A5B7GKF7_PORTR|nr:hypothetical protein [Portunus trituberculatus]